MNRNGTDQDKTRTGGECVRIRPLISAMADGETTPEETAQVQAHLAGCMACESYLAFLRTMTSSLSAMPAATPSSALFDRIAAATYEKPSLWQRMREWLVPLPARWAVGGLGTLAAAGLVTMLVLPRVHEMNHPLVAEKTVRMAADSSSKTAADAATEGTGAATVAMADGETTAADVAMPNGAGELPVLAEPARVAAAPESTSAKKISMSSSTTITRPKATVAARATSTPVRNLTADRKPVEKSRTVIAKNNTVKNSSPGTELIQKFAPKPVQSAPIFAPTAKGTASNAVVAASPAPRSSTPVASGRIPVAEPTPTAVPTPEPAAVEIVTNRVAPISRRTAPTRNLAYNPGKTRFGISLAGANADLGNTVDVDIDRNRRETPPAGQLVNAPSSL
ncbi:MAG: hypothetical protein OHK0029_06780 [Armatimonadaceae bacterium]